MCMQTFITIFPSIQEIGQLILFFRIWSSAKPRPMKNVISQSLGLDLVNINVYAKVCQNIPLSSRDRAIFTFSEFEPLQRLSQSQLTFDNVLGYILAISMRMQNLLSKYSKRFRVIDIIHKHLHKLSGHKIKCLIIGHSMKVNLRFQLTFLGSCSCVPIMNIRFVRPRLQALKRQN